MKTAQCLIAVLIIILLFSRQALALSYLTSGTKNADKIAAQAGFEKQKIQTSYFILTSYLKPDTSSDDIIIYIEGDGFAWSSRRMPSGNPTPKDPVALKLAVVDEQKNIAYLARPCQYISEKEEINHDSKYWSYARFSEEVIGSMNEAVEVLKNKVSAKSITLIGYSGGAAIAVLIASRRNDISEIITVAGNLDHAAINAYHKVSAMKGSLNPIDYAQAVSHIPQRHFAGSKDKVVPLSVIKGFAYAAGDIEYKSVIVVDGCSHNNGWQDVWKDIYKGHS
jgi:hypothetical protein